MQLSTEQITTMLQEIAEQDKGFESVLQITLEAMMRAERSEHNTEHQDSSNGYRSSRVYGRGKVLELKVPRSRHGQFYPILLSMLRNQDEESRQMAYELYGAGLTTTQVGDMFEKIYGQHYSKSSVSRMFCQAREEVQAWLSRPLERYYPILYIDATFIATRRGDSVSKEAYYTVLGVKSDRTREVLVIENLPTESATGWREALSRLKARGVQEVELIVSDGLSAIENSVSAIWPGSTHQLCGIHLQRGVLSKLKPKDKGLAAEQLKAVLRTDHPEDSPAAGYSRWQAFCHHWQKQYPSFGNMATHPRYMLYFNYLKYDYRARPMLYSTNWIERLNRDYKRSTRMRGALPDSQAALLLLGYVAMNRKAYSRKVPKLDYAIQFRWEDNEHTNGSLSDFST